MTAGSDSGKELIVKLELARKQIAKLEYAIELNDKTPDVIREIEEKYKFIVNAYGELMTLINKDYMYELVNDSLCRAFGKSRDEFIGKTVAEVWGKEKFTREIKIKIDKCFRGEIFKEEDTFMIPGGEKRYYAVTYYPYHNEHKEITHIVGVTNDITDRKKAEIALKRSEEELRVLNEKKDKYLAIICSDLEKAASHVRSLLPDPVENRDLRIDWKIVPSVQLGGDSFGYHWIDDEHFAIYILDVAGHGLDAALHSVSVLNTLRFQNLKNTDFRNPGEVLKGLNSVFQMSEHSAKFTTMWYAVYNPSKDELLCAGAGHPPLMIFKEGQIHACVQSKNIMIGVEEEHEFQSDRIELGGSAVIYFYTDGVYEVNKGDGEMMTIEDLEDFLKTHQTQNGAEMQNLYDMLEKHSPDGKLDDDFTIMKVNFKK
jgi:PAS domain S-box-containing protein